MEKKCNPNQWWNNNKCWREYKKILVWEKIMSGILLHVIVKDGKYLTSIMDKIICDEIVDVKEMSFNKKYITCKTQSFYIVSTFLLIIIIDSC